MQLCKIFLQKFFKRPLTPFFLRPDWTPEPLLLGAAQLRLSATINFKRKTTIPNVFSSIFSDFIFQIATPFAKPQDSHPVGYIFYSVQLLEFFAHHQEYCSAVIIGQGVYQNALYTPIAVRV